MRMIGYQYAEHPAMEARQVVDCLKSLGFEVGRKLVRRLMALMDIRAIYPMKSLSKEWLETCETYGIKVSMDGGARCLDNIWIERFWRTIKREYIYLNPEDNVVALRRGIAGFIDYYNTRRSHQEIGHKIPAQVYAMAA